MERKALDEGAKGQIRHIVDGLDHMQDADVGNEIVIALSAAKAQGRVPQWLEDKAVAYAVKHHRHRLGIDKSTGASLAKPHWLVKFTRLGMEPPLPFGKTSAVVCALTREDAFSQVPMSPNYPATATRTDKPVTFTHHCRCAKQPHTEAAGGKRRHGRLEGIGKLAREVNSLIRR